MFFEQVYRAQLFELRCNVDGSPTEERGAEARDDEGNDIACSVHAVVLAQCSPGRAMTAITQRAMRHLPEPIVHAGFDDMLALCDGNWKSGDTSQRRPAERGYR